MTWRNCIITLHSFKKTCNVTMLWKNKNAWRKKQMNRSRIRSSTEQTTQSQRLSWPLAGTDWLHELKLRLLKLVVFLKALTSQAEGRHEQETLHQHLETLQHLPKVVPTLPGGHQTCRRHKGLRIEQSIPFLKRLGKNDQELPLVVTNQFSKR